MKSVFRRIEVWGDSVLKGVIYDEKRQRYTHLEENVALLSLKDLGLEVNNRTRFGMTAPKAHKLMEEALKKGLEAEAAVIEFGGNDSDFDWETVANEPHKEHAPKTPIDVFKQCITDMVKLLRSFNIKPVLMNLPPIDAVRYFSWITRNGLNESNILAWLGDVQHIYRFHECYSLSIMSLANSLGCDIIDVRQPFLLKKDFNRYLCEDGIHPNRAGYELIRQSIQEYGSSKLLA